MPPKGGKTKKVLKERLLLWKIAKLSKHPEQNKKTYENRGLMPLVHQACFAWQR